MSKSKRELREQRRAAERAGRRRRIPPPPHPPPARRRRPRASSSSSPASRSRPPAARRPSPSRQSERGQARRRHPGEGRRARRSEGPDHRHRVPRSAVPDLRRGLQGQPPRPDRNYVRTGKVKLQARTLSFIGPDSVTAAKFAARRQAAGQAVGVPGDVLRVAGPGELRLRDRRLPRRGRQGLRRRRRQGRRVRRRRLPPRPRSTRPTPRRRR